MLGGTIQCCGIKCKASAMDYETVSAAEFGASLQGISLNLQACDKSGHGLREAVILSPSGYAFVPSVPL